MADDFIFAHIKNLPLFKKLSDEQLALMTEAFEVFQVPPNTVIFQQGQPLAGLHLIVQGRAFLMQRGSDGSDFRVGEIVPYQYLGEAALFRQVIENRSLLVVETVVLLRLTRQRFEAVLATHPEIRANLTSQYATFPETVKPLFKGQRPNEKVLLIRRKHPWSFVHMAFVPVIFGIGLMLGGLLLFAGSALSLLLMALGLAVPVLWFIYVYVEWQAYAVIITDQRVIRIENILWKFESNISEVPLSSVQEVNFDVPRGDVFARTFDYGTLEIKTAGSAGNMVLPFMHQPDHIQRLLLVDKENFHKEAKQRNRAAIREEIDRFLTPQENARANTTEQAQPKEKVRPGFLSTRYINEDGDIVYRKHLSVWLAHIFLPVLLVLGGFLLFVLGLMSVELGLLGTVEAFAGVAIMLFGGIWLFWADWDWRNDLYVLRDTTINLIHRRPLFLQNENDKVLLTQVDNVISDKRGAFNVLLDRGNVHISLVGDDKGGGKTFRKVYQPDRVQEEISNRRAAVLARAKEEEVRRQRQEIAEYIDVYHERLERTQQEQQAQQAPPPAPPTPAPVTEQPVIRSGTRPPRIPRVRSD